MALTQGAWTAKSVNGLYRATCNVAFEASDTDAYTLKTPAALNPTKPWTLIIAAAATVNGEAQPLDIWVGHTDDFALSGQGASVVAADGGMFKQICDDCVLAVTTVEYVFYMEPQLAVADVVTVAAIASGFKINIPVAPYYAFNLDGSTALVATNMDFVIVQSQK